jgi:uncharacterized protein
MPLVSRRWSRRACTAGVAVATGVSLAAMAVACDVAPDAASLPPPARPTIRIVYTAGDNGGYISGFRDAFQRAMPEYAVDVQSAPPSTSSVDLLRNGNADAGVLFADVAYLASVGKLDERDEPIAGIRAIVGLPTRAVQVVVSPHSDARSIRDLRGRRVSLGAPGAHSTALTAEVVLKAFGMGPDDVELERLPFSDAAKQLIDGSLEAAFWSGSVPNANVVKATTGGARLLDVMGPDVERIRLEYPFLKVTQIPAHSYPRIGHPVRTVGIDGIFVCKAEMDEDLVYELTKAFFRSLPDLARDSRGFRGFVMNRALSIPIPLHPGAARYYRELELLR